MIYLLSRRRFGCAWYHSWDHYHDCCICGIWTCHRIMLGHVWVVNSPPNKMSVYMRVITHVWMYLLVIIFVTFGLRGALLAIIFVLVTL